MTAASDSRQIAARTAPGHRRPGSLVSPFVRHTLVLVGAALVGYLLAVYMPIESQPELWIGAALVLGLLSALVAGGWLGAFFLLVGAVMGVMVEMHLRLGASPETAQELSATGPLLLVALGAMALAFVAGLVLLRLVRRG